MQFQKQVSYGENHPGGSMGKRPNTGKFIAMMLAAIAVLALKPAPAYAWWNSDWAARKAITLDTTATGADIADPVGTTPVLIRLDVSDFTFDAANPDGSDLRFVAADDKTPLAYHIEKYDHLLGQAFIWVNVPDVKPEAQTSFYLYYGNPKAAAADDAKGSYDANMVAVYHFGEDKAPPKDVTRNANTALTPGQADNFALIGPGERLDGQTPIQLPATPSLGWAAGQAATWSIWFNETALQPGALLYSRTDGTSTVQIGIDNGAPFVAITTAAGTQRSSTGAAISPASWHQLTIVTGASITLYVDGIAYGSLSASLPGLNSVAYLGGDATAGTAPATPAVAPPASPTTTPATPVVPATPAAVPATTGFIGSIDELEISNIARPVGFIKFAAYGQGNNPLAGKLLSYAAEEKPASWFSGNFAVILGSVTADGWVIIGILIIMAIISWAVMADKIAYVNRVDKANGRFMESYRNQGTDLTALPAHTGKGNGLEASPLYGIYEISALEIAKRFAHEQRDRVLSAQSIAAIRSSLDGGLVRQVQKLNRSMVLLTIAIAGGPFIGLLGTVLGVMITFASIAASGNVNINAIAPGISAALVATVAGLIVAIPSLFGYNYLNSRISNGIADMHVFVDELETRMAEVYSPATVTLQHTGV
jgi:biopolymer transport protein ExbB